MLRACVAEANGVIAHKLSPKSEKMKSEDDEKSEMGKLTPSTPSTSPSTLQPAATCCAPDSLCNLGLFCEFV